MNPALDTMVRREQLRFTPNAGEFDVGRIAAAIAGIGASFRDAADPSKFAIFADPESRDAFQARRRTDPASRFPYTPLVTATPTEVIVSPIASHPDLRALSLQFLDWLTTTYDCRLVEEGADAAPPDAADLEGG
jgi:hypothetical protein